MGRCATARSSIKRRWCSNVLSRTEYKLRRNGINGFNGALRREKGAGWWCPWVRVWRLGEGRWNDGEVRLGSSGTKEKAGWGDCTCSAWPASLAAIEER